jgi:hypothetical protein
MTQQSLITPDVAAVEYRGLIEEYLSRVSETATSVRPVSAINPPDNEMIEIDPDTQ